MKLIWTYYPNILFDKKDYPIIILNYHIASIQAAKKLGYYTIIYTDIVSSEKFKDVVDEIVVVNNYEDSPLFDALNIKVLEERQDEYCLIDGDVILHNHLPQFIGDVVFDCYEKTHLNGYSKILSLLDELGINEIIKDWKSEKQNVINIGMLSIRNNELKQKYINDWKLYNEFIKKHLDKFTKDSVNDKPTLFQATAVGAQYLLTMISNSFKYTKQPLQLEVRTKGEYYQHHSGDIKYLNPIIPITILKNDINKSFI